jgi:hypothetical protein
MPSRRSLPEDPKRRELLKRGLAAAPLIVTLAARPVRAQAMGSLGMYDYGAGTNEDPEIDDVPPPTDPPPTKGKGKKR